MLSFRGYNSVECAEVIKPVFKFHWFPGMFESATNNDSKIVSKLVGNQLGRSIKINNFDKATVSIQPSFPNGLQFGYGEVTDSSWSTTALSEKMRNCSVVRFGSIPIPKYIDVDFYVQFRGNTHEICKIYAHTSQAEYELLYIQQYTIDGNYGYGTNGVHIDNQRTRIKTWAKTAAVQTCTARITRSMFTNCFKYGETECDISIIRPMKTYHGGTNAGMKEHSTLVWNNLEINWGE